MHEKLSDNELIKKIQGGDTLCYRPLIDRYRNYAFTLAYRVLDNREDAEEVAHDAFMKAFNSIKNFKMESKFTTWFYRIVVNQAISRKRKKRIQTQEISERESDLDHYSRFDDMGDMPAEDRRHFLAEAMRKLNDEERTLITLYYYKELEMDEIAEITQLDRNNLKVKLFRARKRLAASLGSILKTELKSIL